MRKSRKSLKKLSACILAAAMTVTLAAPFSPLAEVKAAGEEAVNLALNAAATANDTETNDYPASKAVDGIVNRDAQKPQSRWATNTSAAQDPKILTVDLGEAKTFQSFVIAWERLNITSYKIQTADSNTEDAEWTTVYEKEGEDPISDLNENIHLASPVVPDLRGSDPERISAGRELQSGRNRRGERLRADRRQQTGAGQGDRRRSDDPLGDEYV